MSNVLVIDKLQHTVHKDMRSFVFHMNLALKGEFFFDESAKYRTRLMRMPEIFILKFQYTRKMS